MRYRYIFVGLVSAAALVLGAITAAAFPAGPEPAARVADATAVTAVLTLTPARPVVMKTLFRVALAAAALAAGVRLTPAGSAAGGAAWMVTRAATAALAICAMARLSGRTPVVAGARGPLGGLVRFTSSRLDAARAGIGGPFAAAGSGRPATTVEMIVRPAGSGLAPAGAPAVPARSRTCLSTAG
jgi:hypothetical protein